MFRAILTSDENKRGEDFERITTMMNRLEELLEKSASGYLYDSLTMADFYFAPIVIRLFYLRDSEPIIGTDVFSNKMTWVDKFPRIRTWVFKIRDSYPGICSAEMFLAMIKEFLRSGKWGLYLPLAKL